MHMKIVIKLIKNNTFIIMILIITILLLIENIYKLSFANYTTNIILNLLSCFIMIFIIIFSILHKKYSRFYIPKIIYVLLVLFAFCSILLGDVLDFYGKFKFWDTIMHISSGILLSMFGIIIINSICSIKSINVYPLIIVFLSFCFAMMMQSMWEIYEYTMDHFIGTNMQTYMKTTTSSYIEDENIALCGHNALNDTMKDFICNALAALFVSVLGFYNLKTKKGIYKLKILLK